MKVLFRGSWNKVTQVGPSNRVSFVCSVRTDCRMMKYPSIKSWPRGQGQWAARVIYFLPRPKQCFHETQMSTKALLTVLHRTPVCCHTLYLRISDRGCLFYCWCFHFAQATHHTPLHLFSQVCVAVLVHAPMGGEITVLAEPVNLLKDGGVCQSNISSRQC